MEKEVVVISLGGSLVYPSSLKEPDVKYLEKFEKFLDKLEEHHKVVILCGGGYPARSYMIPLQKRYKDQIYITVVGVATTRLNALFVAKFLKANQEIPETKHEVKKLLETNKVVVCGALEVGPKQTTDSNAADVAALLNGKFANLTDVKGLYDKDPKKNKDAKFTKEISFEDFNEIVSKIKFKSGQHFVLDQTAAKTVYAHKVPTAIIKGTSFKSIENFIKGNDFDGTLIH